MALATRPSARNDGREFVSTPRYFNRTPFVFGKTSFDALCSDLDAFRISEAVSASAAVPLAFAHQCCRPLRAGTPPRSSLAGARAK